MFGIGMTELMIIFVIALLVLGPTKLPQVAKSIGKGLRELRRASDDLKSAVMFDDDQPQRYRPPTPPPVRELPAPGGEPEVFPENGERVAEAGAEDDEDLPEAAITGSAAAPSGTISRGTSLEDEHDPDDADDHSGMDYAPGSPELDQLIADAKVSAQEAKLDEDKT